MKRIKIASTKEIRDYIEAHRSYKAFPSSEPRKEVRLAARAAIFKGSDDISAALDLKNGRASTHTYGASDIVYLAVGAERRLEGRGVTVKNRAGTRVHGLSGVPTSKTYNRKSRTAIATEVYLERTSSAWYLTLVDRRERYTGPGGGESISYKITRAAHDDIVRQATDGFQVIEKF